MHFSTDVIYRNKIIDNWKLLINRTKVIGVLVYNFGKENSKADRINGPPNNIVVICFVDKNIPKLIDVWTNETKILR